MKRDGISLRQMMVVLITALLAPLSELVPVISAQAAQGMGWLVPLGAIPLLLATLWSAGRLARGGICAGGGKPMGYIIIILYMGWSLVILAAVLGQCSVRLAQIYEEGPAFVCTAFLLALAVWMAMGKVSAFARAGEIFYLILAVALAAVLLLAAFLVQPGHLRGAEGLRGVPVGSAAAAGIILNVYPAAALGKRIVFREKDTRRAVGWTLAAGVVGILLAAAVLGCLGTGLTLQLPAPFLSMVQGLGVKGAFQRTEALVAALWTLSDLTMAGLLLHAWRAMAQDLHPGKWGKYSIPAAGAAALMLGWLLLKKEGALRCLWDTVLPAAGLLFGLLIPMILCLLARVWRRPK